MTGAVTLCNAHQGRLRRSAPSVTAIPGLRAQEEGQHARGKPPMADGTAIHGTVWDLTTEYVGERLLRANVAKACWGFIPKAKLEDL